MINLNDDFWIEIIIGGESFGIVADWYMERDDPVGTLLLWMHQRQEKGVALYNPDSWSILDSITIGPRYYKDGPNCWWWVKNDIDADDYYPNNFLPFPCRINFTGPDCRQQAWRAAFAAVRELAKSKDWEKCFVIWEVTS